MIETIYSNPDELYHHGVKGMKWGVRHDPDRASNRERVKAAKKNYKAAKKAYNQSYKKWYWHSGPHISPEKRHANEVRFQKALVDAGEMAVAKGKYMQAKGVAKNKPKMVAKGKYIVNTATNTKKYNVKVASLMDKGYSYREANKQLSNEYTRAVNRQERENARHRKELMDLKKR